MDQAKFYKVKSFSNSDIDYTVRQIPTGEWKCSCPASVFAKKGSKTCDHIRKVRHQKLIKHGWKRLNLDMSRAEK